MGSFSIWHWLVVLLVVLLLFGSGKISGLMGDLAKGIKSFKHNIKEDQADASMEAQAQGPASRQHPRSRRGVFHRAGRFRTKHAPSSGRLTALPALAPFRRGRLYPQPRAIKCWLGADKTIQAAGPGLEIVSLFHRVEGPRYADNLDR